MKFAFTFGLGYDLGHNYVNVEADNENEARAKFVGTRALITEGLDEPERRWAFCYPYPEFEQQIMRHDLIEVPIDTPIRWRDDANPKE